MRHARGCTTAPSISNPHPRDTNLFIIMRHKYLPYGARGVHGGRWRTRHSSIVAYMVTQANCALGGQDHTDHQSSQPNSPFQPYSSFEHQFKRSRSSIFAPHSFAGPISAPPISSSRLHASEITCRPRKAAPCPKLTRRSGRVHGDKDIYLSGRIWPLIYNVRTVDEGGKSA